MVYDSKDVETIVKVTIWAEGELAGWFKERVEEGCARRERMITPEECYEAILSKVKNKLEELEKIAEKIMNEPSKG